jgi:hypothetical protein
MLSFVVPAWGAIHRFILGEDDHHARCSKLAIRDQPYIPMHPSFLTPGDWPIPEEVEWLWKVWLSEKRNPELLIPGCRKSQSLSREAMVLHTYLYRLRVFWLFLGYSHCGCKNRDRREW